MENISVKKRSKFNKTAFVLLFPTVVTFIFILIYPIINGIYASFTDQLFSYDKFSFIGIGNYSDILRDPLFWKSLQNSIKLVLFTTIFNLIIGFGLALALNDSSGYVSIFRVLLFIPWILPSAVVSFSFKWLYNDFYGYFNYILTKFHIIETPVNLLASTDLVWLGILIPSIWFSYPFFMIVFLSSLKSIDKNIYEAAKIDGANRLQTFKYITLPILKPTFIILTILQVIWEFSSFDLVYLLTKGGPASSTLTLSLYIYKKAFEFKTVGYACALAVVLSIILLIFTMIYFYIIRRNNNE